MEPYIEECGGEIYSDCDDQERIWNDAVAVAEKHNRKILMIIGADWCASCHAFNEMLHSDEEAFVKFSEKYVFIEINGDKASSLEALEETLGVKVYGFPTGFLVAPLGLQVLAQTFPSQYQSIEELEAFLDGQGEQDSPAEIQQAIAQVYNLGAASVDLANKDIELEIENNGIKWVSAKDSESAAYLNQGVAFLHVFHYIDALRSFKMAEKIDPDSLYPAAGMILSYLQLSAYESEPFIAELISRSKKKAEGASERERQWYQLAVSIYQEQSSGFSRIANPESKTVTEALQVLLNSSPQDVEVLTLANFMAGNASDIESFQKALEIDPLHTGANHYIVHYREATGSSTEALKNAEILAAQAPYGAHAIHMLGHLLPDLGRWTEAEELFAQADEIHRNWSERNAVPTTEDWHYAHNVHLRAITQIGLGQIDKGIEALEKACEFDPRSCMHMYATMMISGDLEQIKSSMDDRIASQIAWQPYLQEYYDEIEIIQKGSTSGPISEAAEEHLKLMQKIADSQGTSTENKKSLKSEIDGAIQMNFPQSGFDSWSTGLLRSLRILALTARLQDQDLYNSTLESVKKKANEFNFDLYGQLKGSGVQKP